MARHIPLPPGGTVARAKRTDRRAEARRRYRATLVEGVDEADLDEDLDTEPSAAGTATGAPTGRSRARASASVAQAPVRPARPSVLGALRAAFRPADFRGDLAALPSLIRHRSFFIPLAMIVGAAAVIAVTGGNEPISRMLSPYFLAPPPVAPVFLAGFLAPRASYLLGAILGIVSSVAIIVVLSSPALQQAATGTPATGLQADVVAYSFLVATFGGAFYAAAAAWYKRFLALANPGRAARPTGKPTDRTKRRDPNDRPMLARRR
jgi:hypothetical protein